MGLFDKAKDKAEELKGGAKEHVGDATGNESLQAEGTKDKASGKIKGAGEEIKEGLSDAKDKLT